jgi:tubulin polyglutamylase TTLL11
MVRSSVPSLHLARRVYHRNEQEPLQKALEQLGWTEEPKVAAASIIWDVETLADTPFNGGQPPLPHQLVTKLPGMLHCCRKAAFAHIVARLRALLPADSPLNDGKYIPSQWALPVQQTALSAHVQQAAAAAKGKGRPAPTYIVKPDGGSQGDGITLTADPCKPAWGGASNERVVQEYVAEPLLLDGLKFDLRLYVLVLSVRHHRPFDIRAWTAMHQRSCAAAQPRVWPHCATICRSAGPSPQSLPLP